MKKWLTFETDIFWWCFTKWPKNAIKYEGPVRIFVCIKFTSWKSIKNMKFSTQPFIVNKWWVIVSWTWYFLHRSTRPQLLSVSNCSQSLGRLIITDKYLTESETVLKHFSSETIIRTQMGPEVLILSNTNSKFLEGLTHSSMLSEITYIQQKFPWCLSWPAGTSIS